MSILDNLLSWLIFGSVIGSLFYMLEPEDLRGKDPILLGIIGAIVTGVVANFVLNIPLTQFSLISLMVALCGACFVVIGGRTLKNI